MTTSYMDSNYNIYYSILFFIYALIISTPAAADGGAELAPPPPQVVNSDESTIKVNAHAATIILIFIGGFFVIGLVSIYLRSCAERRMSLDGDDGGSRRRRHRGVARGLDPDIIDTFPTFLYSDVKGLKLGKAALECAVCLNEFDDEEMLRLLPVCCHVFHPDCIDVWLASHVTCPVCRANLVPRAEEPGRITILSHDHDNSDREHVSVHDSVDSEMEISQIPSNGSPGGSNPVQPPVRNRPPRSLPRQPRKFPRSHSTGHCSLPIRPGDNCERFTLRLPEEIRTRLVNSGLSRNQSCTDLPGERSSRKGYRSKSSNGSVRGRAGYYERFDGDVTAASDRWGFMHAPPFFSRGSSTRSSKEDGGGGGGDELTAIPKSLFKSVKTPLGRFFGGAEKDETGERSFSKLMHENPV